MMVETFDAVVVGGGLGGIYMVHQYVSTVKKMCSVHLPGTNISDYGLSDSLSKAMNGMAAWVGSGSRTAIREPRPTAVFLYIRFKM